ncbi:Rho GTPase-activating protein 40 [Tupaia chinensis]|uniref:Rho GTPase-activating protein 40 n=1 Tax=Tupaia chinensis TaxID=246437 RepID=L9L3W9_TUPCH|nr:Rho GTPase-activating protein 40 [Tupaia chinensis]
MKQLPRKNALQSRPANCFHQRLSSAESLSMDGFWIEVEQIQQRDELKDEDGGGEGLFPEEGEAESQWLQDTGLLGLLGGLGLNCDHRGLLSTLTRTQVSAVCRRLDICARSARRRHKAPVRDVRDVFGVFGSGEVSSENGDSGMKWTQLSSGAPPSPPVATAAAEPWGPQEQAGREEAFNMDSAYSEQAAALLQRARPLPGGACAWDRGALPKFRIPKGRLGVTRIGDLSLEDMRKIPSLALIELTALCDVLGLDLKRSKVCKWKAAETRLFGVPLDSLLEADHKVLPGTRVPLVLQALLSCLEKRGLDAEGILRVPGSQARVKGLEQQLERDFYAGLFSWDGVHHNDASDLLKRFIRKLPVPLLTAEYLPAFAVVPRLSISDSSVSVGTRVVLSTCVLISKSASIAQTPLSVYMFCGYMFLPGLLHMSQHADMELDIPDLKQRLQALHLLILLLPEPNRNALKALLEFLRKVVAREQHNKMTLWNVSTVMAPNLFLHQGRLPRLLKGKEKQLAEGAAEVVQMMVQYQDLLWTLCDGGLKTWLRRIHADRDKAVDGPEASPQVAKIQVAWPIEDLLRVPLTPNTKVAHVLKQFTQHPSPDSEGQGGSEDKDGLLAHNRSMDSAHILLYEVGGNISEHRLDPDAYLLDLYRANPYGEWVIKQSPT